MSYSNNNLSQLNSEGKFKYPVDKKTKRLASVPRNTTKCTRRLNDPLWSFIAFHLIKMNKKQDFLVIITDLKPFKSYETFKITYCC